jgi:WD40 repeat protein
MNNDKVPNIINWSAGIGLNNNQKANQTTKLKHVFKPDRCVIGVRSVNVSSDNRYLIITFISKDGFIRVFDLEKLELLLHSYTGHTDSVRLTTVSRDNQFCYTASWDGTSRKFQLATGECTQILGSFGRSPSCFLDQENRWLFTASYDRDIEFESGNVGRCWDIKSGKPIYYYKHQKVEADKDPESVDIAYDQQFVYTGSDDGVAYRFNLTGGMPLLKYFSFTGSVRKVAVTSKFFVAACTNGLVRVHDKISGELFKNLFHSNDQVMDVRISKDENYLFSASMDGSVKCFNITTGEERYHYKIHNNWIWSISLMNSDTVLVTGSVDGTVVFLSADTGDVLARLLCFPAEHEFLINCIADKIFPDGFFFTNNHEFVQVALVNEDNNTEEILKSNDLRRIEYINKLNLKNLVLTRLRNNRHYTSMTNNFLGNRKTLERQQNAKLPLGLRS